MEKDVVEELKFPRTIVSRLVKRELPKEVHVSHEAKTAIARVGAMFVLHVASNAQDSAKANGRKMVQVRDVMNALHTLNCGELEKPVLEAVKQWSSLRAQRLCASKKRKEERTSAISKAKVSSSSAAEVTILSEDNDDADDTDK